MGGANVSGNWIVNGISAPAFCQTDEFGTCSILLSKIDIGIKSVDFEVTDIFLDGYLYDPGNNIVTGLPISQ
ncbi:MAG: hypothetical protein P8046_14985 [Anaerolineales bacterium]